MESELGSPLESDFYSGFHAELYDDLYANKNYSDEASAISRILASHGANSKSHLLELACGTGRHALEFSRLGFQVTATDVSPSMLGIARANVEKSKLPIELRLMDMTALDLPTGHFDAATCLFDSIGYLLTNERIISALTGIRRALRKNGVLILEFWHAAPMIRSFEPFREKVFAHAGLTYLRESRTSLDLVEQTATVAFTLFDSPQKKRIILNETQRNRFFLCQEMALLLTSAGFRKTSFFPSFNPQAQINSETWHICAVAQNVEG